MDVSKAYNRMEWDFLKKIMQKFNINKHVMSVILKYLASCFFSMRINGQNRGFFSSRRGLRQGEPLSPYLFVMVVEYLIRGVKNHTKNPHWRYRNETYINIAVLAFTDDILIFTKGKVEGLKKLWKYLKHYKKINYGESTLIMSNRMEEMNRQDIVQNFGINIKELPFVYLGAPIFKGHN